MAALLAMNHTWVEIPSGADHPNFSLAGVQNLDEQHIHRHHAQGHAEGADGFRTPEAREVRDLQRLTNPGLGVVGMFSHGPALSTAAKKVSSQGPRGSTQNSSALLQQPCRR